MNKKTYKRRMARAWRSLEVYNDDDQGYRKVKSGKPISGKTMKRILSCGIYKAIEKEAKYVAEVESLRNHPISDGKKYVLFAQEYGEYMYFIWPQEVR